MNKIIERINFKIIIIIYFISLLIFGSILGVLTINTYKEKLSLLYNYHKISEIDKISKNKLTKFNKYKEIIDVVVIEDNTVKYSLKNKYNNIKPNLYYENYYIDKSNNTILEILDETEFIKQSIKGREDEELFILNNSNMKYKYSLIYTYHNNYSVYFIINNTINNTGILYLKLDLALLVFYFMVYWIIVTLIIYQDAMKIKVNQYKWSIIVLLTNIIGVIIYLIYKHRGTICENCHSYQDVNNLYCINCGTKLYNTCDNCNHVITGKYCPNCGKKH